MKLTKLGEQKAKLDAPKRVPFAKSLMSSKAPARVEDYMAGVCYDAVAYVRYLLGANISYQQLTTTSGNDWIPFLDQGKSWTGGAIPEGTAVVFRRPNKGAFHAAVSLGGTKVRGINGGKLGTGWVIAGDSDISGMLKATAPQASTFAFEKETIEVLLSDL
jgi:hypothetical protein